ncbi:MAG: hypothetical protein OHK93_003127 [Ramalina farinacea]|uniref:Uncharacterized protein n=1 Tax=Ramalina farinacea TaxID=258253 RepID=A0AA43QSN6_9LECA|nr:hypothetical protein [Ramalina farinacea]
MIILWALVFSTKVVGLALPNQTSDAIVSNAWVQPPFMDADFITTFETNGDTYLDQASVFEDIIVAFGRLCNTQYKALIGSETFFRRGHDASIIELDGGRLLAVDYTMWAMYWCFFEIRSRPQSAFRYNEAQCTFGFQEPDRRLRVGSLRFMSNRRSTVSSSRPGANIDVTRRIKPRDSAASAVAANLNAIDPSQASSLVEAYDPVFASTNTSVGQESSSTGNLTSVNLYTYQLRGNGPLIDLDRLLVSVLEVLIDRASRSRDGPILARNYRSVNGDYDIGYRPSPLRDTPDLSYKTVVLCYLKLVTIILISGRPLREGEFTCLVNSREALLGRFTRKAGGNMGIASQEMSEHSISAPVAEWDD